MGRAPHFGLKIRRTRVLDLNGNLSDIILDVRHSKIIDPDFVSVAGKVQSVLFCQAKHLLIQRWKAFPTST